VQRAGFVQVRVLARYQRALVGKVGKKDGRMIPPELCHQAFQQQIGGVTDILCLDDSIANSPYRRSALALSRSQQRGHVRFYTQRAKQGQRLTAESGLAATGERQNSVWDTLPAYGQHKNSNYPLVDAAPNGGIFKKLGEPFYRIPIVIDVRPFSNLSRTLRRTSVTMNSNR
jgi:hypothetical protein